VVSDIIYSDLADTLLKWSGLMIIKQQRLNGTGQIAVQAFTCLASSPEWGRSCQTWVSWRGLRSCTAASAYRYEGKSLEEWSAGDLREPPGEQGVDTKLKPVINSGYHEGMELYFWGVYRNVSVSIYTDKPKGQPNNTTPTLPSCLSPCVRGQQKGPPWSPAPTATQQSSTCQQIFCWCLQASFAELQTTRGAHNHDRITRATHQRTDT